MNNSEEEDSHGHTMQQDREVGFKDQVRSHTAGQCISPSNDMEKNEHLHSDRNGLDAEGLHYKNQVNQYPYIPPFDPGYINREESLSEGVETRADEDNNNNSNNNNIELPIRVDTAIAVLISEENDAPVAQVVAEEEKSFLRRYFTILTIVLLVVIAAVFAAGFCISGKCSQASTANEFPPKGRASTPEPTALLNKPSQSTSPTQTPTISLAPTLSPVPSQSPTMTVSVEPTLLPTTTSAPTTEECFFDITAECFIQENTTQICDGYSLTFVEYDFTCRERPFNLTLLFNGGNCGQSDDVGSVKFTCEDFNGGPPVNETDQAYIHVTDTAGNQIIYFDGNVNVGEIYNIGDGQRLDPEIVITVYSPDRSTLWQEVTLDASCGSDTGIFLTNRFGASQVVGFSNPTQGQVYSFVSYSFAVDIAIPITATGDQNNNIVLTNLYAETNFVEGVIDISDQVFGAMANSSVVVTLTGTIDVSDTGPYNLIFTGEGYRVDMNDTICYGNGTFSFSTLGIQ